MKGINRETGEPVAIKQLTQFIDNAYEFKKVLREIQIMRMLSEMRNNIFTTKLMDIIIPEESGFDSVFLVMNYMPNSLRNLFTRSIEGHIQLTEKEHLLTILYNLLCSINFLHSANIMHRDLKPDNILIESRCQVLLCDFGLSRTIEGLDSNHGSLGAKVGTRWYRAPEVILGCPDYDHRIDVWSLGCVLWELMANLKQNNNRRFDY
jgi:serine/threonine protein kinase